MGVASSVALAVAERVERTAGPRAGLRAWKALLDNTADVDARAKAILAALRCALTIGELGELASLTTLWETIDQGLWDEPLVALCHDTVKAKLFPQAIALAGAEARRHRTARSLYLLARCLELAGDDRAAAAFHDAIMRAVKEGARAVELTSRVRRTVLLGRAWDTLPAALDEARAIDLSKVDALSRLLVARVLLLAPSRFTRATGLDALDGIVQADDPELAIRALRTAARWADDAGDALSPLEADRLVALFGREQALAQAPHARDLVRLLVRMAQTNEEAALRGVFEESARFDPALGPVRARAQDILRGRFEVPRDVTGGPPTDPRSRRTFRFGELLDVLVAMRDRAPARAAYSLRVLAEAEEAGEHLPREVLGIAQAALAYEDTSSAASAQELRDVAVRLIAARLRRPTTGAPPRGFLPLADTLARLGATDVAMTARRAAVAAKEPGAAASLGTTLARAGWRLAEAGERAQAIAKLREAKALLDVR